MKTNFILIMWVSLLLASCVDGEPTVEVTEQADTVITVQTASIPSETVEVANATIDTLQEVQAEDITLDFAKRIKDLNQQCKEEDSKDYVEDIAVDAFQGDYVEMAALEICKIGADSRVSMDFFDVAPLGLRRFYIKDGNLFCIQVIDLGTETNEHGEVVVEKIKYSFYYDNDKLIKTLDKKGKEVDGNAIKWQAENTRDWDIVKSHL